MPGPENVPGTDNGRIQAAVPYGLLTFPADINVSLHDRRGMGDAHVNEMPNAALPGDSDCFQACFQINLNELARLRGAGMSYANQLNESVYSLDSLLIRASVQSIADDSSAPRRQLAARLLASQSENLMSGFLNNRDEPAADVTCSTSDEHATSVSHSGRNSLPQLPLDFA